VSGGLTLASLIAATTLVAHARASVSGWFGGTLPLVAKENPALTVGLKLSAVFPARLIWTVALASNCDLGFLSLKQPLVPQAP
jgi:hypothetical protein